MKQPKILLPNELYRKRFLKKTKDKNKDSNFSFVTCPVCGIAERPGSPSWVKVNGQFVHKDSCLEEYLREVEE